MRDGDRADSLKERLSQLKTSLEGFSFSPKKILSHFMLTTVSFFSVFPNLPQIDPSLFIPREEREEEQISPEELSKSDRIEQCLWRHDVSFFQELGKEEGASLESTPSCREKKGATEESSLTNQELDADIREMAAGYPLEIMAPAISQYDRKVAALIVGIAKKESNWGKRVPRSPDGQDCFNYWGYKGAGTRGMAMGHGCFGSPEEAVQAVGNRLTKLVELRQTSEPKNMIIWKCGSSCATHSKESVSKWISDVDLYYRKIAGI